MTLFDLDPEELPVLASLIAVQLSRVLTVEQQLILGDFLAVVGGNLAFINEQAGVIIDGIKKASKAVNKNNND